MRLSYTKIGTGVCRRYKIVIQKSRYLMHKYCDSMSRWIISHSVPWSVWWSEDSFQFLRCLTKLWSSNTFTVLGTCGFTRFASTVSKLEVGGHVGQWGGGPFQFLCCLLWLSAVFPTLVFASVFLKVEVGGHMRHLIQHPPPLDSPIDFCYPLPINPNHNNTNPILLT